MNTISEREREKKAKSIIRSTNGQENQSRVYFEHYIQKDKSFETSWRHTGAAESKGLNTAAELYIIT